MEPFQQEPSFFVFNEQNRKGIYNSIYALVKHGFDYPSLCEMSLEEYQYYVRLFNEKQDEETLRLAQAERQAAAKARMQDGKPIGEVVPHAPK